ncbi:MAG: hypothetical protein H3Z54_09595 [archaeon]|nr:hypothetical protein [archaeon]
MRGQEVADKHRKAIEVAKRIGISYQKVLHVIYKHEKDGSCRSVNCPVKEGELEKILKELKKDSF